MSQVDNRNSSAAKRARTDGSRREDDWTCPSCGNVNFSFRTTCNMRNCTQPRPADHIAKSSAKPVQLPQNYSPAAPYVGPGAPSSMYLNVGVPPYGSSMYSGSSVPPYDVPFPGQSAYNYNYGTRHSAGSPYRPLNLPPPAPYSGGPMMGHGGMYGMPTLIDRYGGLGLPMSHAPMGLRPGFFPEDKSQKKDSTRDNDWTCPKCGNMNFSFRTVCNMRKCNTAKPGPQGGKSEKSSKQKMPEGSWKCEKCNNLNYPFRTKCNRQNCGADKPAGSPKSPSSTADESDQVCCVMFYIHCVPSHLHEFLFWLIICINPTYSIKILIHRLRTINTVKDLLQGFLFLFPLFQLDGRCSVYIVRPFAILSLASFNLQLSTVPVSTRSCLRLLGRSRVVVVQLCSVWVVVSESQSLSSLMLQRSSSYSFVFFPLFMSVVVLTAMVFKVTVDPSNVSSVTVGFGLPKILQVGWFRFFSL